MAEIEQFTQENLKQVRALMKQALASVEKQVGIQISIGTISYSAGQFTAKMTAVTNASSKTETGEQITVDPKWRSNFLRYAKSWGMSPDDLGTTVAVKGNLYTIVGARPKAQAKMVLQKPDGSLIAHMLDPVVEAVRLGKS